MKNSMFCDVCGKILNTTKNENGQVFGVCSCGFKEEICSGFVVSQNVVKEKERGEGILIEAETRGFPNICKKCGYGECDIHEILPSYSDEAGVILYRCKKCKFVHRQHDGTGNN